MKYPDIIDHLKFTTFMNTLQTIEVVNILIEVNNDRIEAYENASKNVNDVDLKLLFARFIMTSKACCDELKKEVIKLGGTPATGNSSSQLLFNFWMNVKASFATNERLTILSSCESAEHETIGIYSDVLEKEIDYLDHELQAIIFAQHIKIKSEYASVISLRIQLEQLN